jgi:hypothetical protein
MADNNSRAISTQLQEKWAPILDHKDAGEITDSYKKACTAVLLENQEQYLREASPSNSMGGTFSDPQVGSAGNIAGFDPVLISLVRRAMPQLIAYDVCGVQPMTGPTGLIFAMKSRYVSQTGTEALHNEADTDFSGAQPDASDDPTGGTPGGQGGDFGTGGDSAAVSGSTGHNGVAHAGSDPLSGTSPAVYSHGAGMQTTDAERLGDGSGPNFAEMAFSIERIAVEAKSRALKAEYSSELAQDLKAVHGLDAETELANILSNEILAEINREIVRTIYNSATLGCQSADIGSDGVFNVGADADGRWSAENYRGLAFQIEREANAIAKTTRRGKGNMIICSADVASALSMSGLLDFSPVFGKGLTVDDTGNTFAGVLNGRFKVYIDPYAGSLDYCCVGYKGDSPYDAGLFYCPYVPLQMVRAVGENSFQPKIGFKTRYGLVKNPFVASELDARGNEYYRIFRVDGLLGQNA